MELDKSHAGEVELKKQVNETKDKGYGTLC